MLRLSQAQALGVIYNRLTLVLADNLFYQLIGLFFRHAHFCDAELLKRDDPDLVEVPFTSSGFDNRQPVFGYLVLRVCICVHVHFYFFITYTLILGLGFNRFPKLLL